MNVSRTLLSVLCFAGLVVVAVAVAARIGDPGATPVLLFAAAAGAAAGAPGLVRRRAWPLALVLLPAGAYLLARAHVSLPGQTDGAGAHLAFYAGKVQAGALIYARDVAPLDVTGHDGLRLLLVLVVFVVVWAAAFLALSLRRPLAAIIVLLVLTGFGFTIDSSVRDFWPALAFIVLAAGLLAASRMSERGGSRAGGVLAGGATAVLAVVIGLSLLDATAIGASRPLGDWRQWNFGSSTTDLNFDFMQNYPDLLDPSKDRLVMRVRSPLSSYWKANVLDAFDGRSWRSTLPGDLELNGSRRGRYWIYRVPRTSPAPEERLVTQRFEVRGTYVDRLPTGGQPTQLRSTADLKPSLTDGEAIAVTPSRGPAFSYIVEAMIPDIGAMDLIGAGRQYPEDVAQTYLGLPFPALREEGDEEADGDILTEDEWRAMTAAVPGGGEWLGLYALNESIVGDETDPYRIALAIERHLLSGVYAYSLQPPDRGYDSPYAEFLFATRLGYCQHFAGVMAALLRFNGIPARVAVGFTTGEQEKAGVWRVSRNDAHAWVEAYFPGVGWAPFEPTPGRQMPNRVDPEDALANAPDVDELDPVAPQTAADPDLQEGALEDLPGSELEGDLTAPSTSDGRSLWPLGLLGLLVVWPVGRALLRRRGLVRGSTEARIRASVALLRADLRDHGVEVLESSTLDETAAWVKKHLDVDADEVVARVQAIEFGGRAAGDGDLRALAALRRRVRRRLRECSGRLASLLALYGVRPPSARRPHARPGESPSRA